MSQLSDLLTNCPSVEILAEGYSLTANDDGYEGSMRYWISGADLEQFIITVQGLPKGVTIGGNAVTRLVPLIHPQLDPHWNCYADSLHPYPPPDAIASPDGAGGILFSDYFVDVHFSTPPYYMEMGDYPMCRVECDPGLERVTRPGSAYIFPSDGLRLSQPVGVPVPTIDFSITMYRVPQYSLALYKSLNGCVSTEEFYGLDAGTVTYKGPKNRGQQIVAGQPMFTIEHLFNWRAIPQNAIMRPDGKNFEAPIEDNAGSPLSVTTAEEQDDANPIYLLPENDLNQLWGM